MQWHADIKKLISRRSRAGARREREFVIWRCKGRCELCNYFCPPLLEVHHIKPVNLSGNGLYDNLIALCPNCHAIISRLHGSAGGKNDEKHAHFISEWLFNSSSYTSEQLELLEAIIYQKAVLVNDKWVGTGQAAPATCSCK